MTESRPTVPITIESCWRTLAETIFADADASEETRDSLRYMFYIGALHGCRIFSQALLEGVAQGDVKARGRRLLDEFADLAAAAAGRGGTTEEPR